MSRDITEMRSWLRLRHREQAWAYTDRKTKEQYIRVAVKKLDEEDPEFALMNPHEQLELIVERAKKIAVDQANDENEFVAMNAEGQVVDEHGEVDPDAMNPNQPARFGDGSAADVGETRERGRNVTGGPKTFNRGGK